MLTTARQITTSSNGSRNGTSDFLIDGVSTSSFYHNMYVAHSTSLRLTRWKNSTYRTTNFSAEYGFTGTTVTNIVTRSGTNQFHGSAYEFFRNRALDANNFFSNEAGIPLPALRLNNFGATDRRAHPKEQDLLFLRLRRHAEGDYAVPVNSGVPSAAERTGDFGELCTASYFAGGSFDANGMCSNPAGQLWDPYTGVYNAAQGGPVRSGFIPFNNMMTYQSLGNPNLTGTGYQLAAQPGNLIDPIAAKYLGTQYIPLPNFNVGTSAYNPYTNWEGSPVTLTNIDDFDIKIDHRFSERDVLSGKYSRSRNTQPPFPCYSNTDPADPCTVGTSIATAHLVAINYTHTFGPALLLTVTYGLTRGFDWNETPVNEPQFKGISATATLGMPAYMERSGIFEMPSVTFAAYSVPANEFGSATGQLGNETSCCEREGSDTHDLEATLNWVKGNHNLKFGGNGMMFRVNHTLPGAPAGGFTYDFTSTSEFPFSGGGDDIASFLTGVGGPGASGSYDVPNFTSTQSFQFAAYVQDDWKVSKKLTLNLGFRNEFLSPQTERYNRMNKLDPSMVSPLQVPGLPTLHGGEVYMSPSDRSNYLARL